VRVRAIPASFASGVSQAVRVVGPRCIIFLRSACASVSSRPLPQHKRLQEERFPTTRALRAPVREVAQSRGFLIGQHIRVEVIEGRLTILPTD
jgi:hypothetical protein